MKKLEENIQKEKDKRRLMKSLSNHKLPQEQLNLLHSSGSIGQRESKKQKLQRALREHRAGIKQSDPSVELFRSVPLKTENLVTPPSSTTTTAPGTTFTHQAPTTVVQVGKRKRKKLRADSDEEEESKRLKSFEETPLASSTSPTTPMTASSSQDSITSPSTQPDKPKEAPTSKTPSTNNYVPPQKTADSNDDSDSDSDDSNGESGEEGEGVDDLMDDDYEKPMERPPMPEEIERLQRGQVVPIALTLNTTVRHVTRTPELEEARHKLPILSEEQPIMEAVLSNPNHFVLICGETGSGKTTQVPQFLYEAGFSNPHAVGNKYPGLIGVTQPRRVAAAAMSQRVAVELNVEFGKEVGYQVRHGGNFKDNVGRIKFMTEGILLREIQSDFLLKKYSVIIIDEAHERSLNTDVLLGLLSRIVPLRATITEENSQTDVAGPLKVIIMSATLRVTDFSENARMFPLPPPVLKIASRQYSVTVHFNKRTQEDYLNEAFQKTCKIHNKLPPGGILVFLTGQDEIEFMCKMLSKKLNGKFHATKAKASEETAKGKSDVDLGHFGGEGDIEEDVNVHDYAEEEFDFDVRDEDDDEEPDTLKIKGTIPDEEAAEAEAEKEKETEKEKKTKKKGGSGSPYYDGVTVLPLFAMLSSELQQRVFSNPEPNTRLIVVSTNVAETSLTIPNIRYVIDCGRVKERIYDTVSGISRFEVVWSTQASADQRAGRAGRVGPGHCYRLYSSALYNDTFPKHPLPEICRIPIEGVVLQMKSMSIDNLPTFPFPTPPDPAALQTALKNLLYLGALKEEKKKYTLTPLGRTLALFPVAPRFAKMLTLGKQEECLNYVIAIVAVLATGSPVLRGGSSESAQNNQEDETDDFDEENEDLKQQLTSAEEKARRRKFREEQEKRLNLWRHPQSDLLTLLRIVGAHDYAKKKDSIKFCRDHFLHHKTINEIDSLRAQLTRLVNALITQLDPKAKVLDPTQPIRPPTARQELLLRQIIAAGLIDQVAKYSPDPTLAAINPNNSNNNNTVKSSWIAPRTYRTTLTNAEAEVHFTSSVAVPRSKQKKGEGPDYDYLVYSEIIESRSGRKYMKGVTVISPSWLSRLANESLCKLSKPLESPPPRYHRNSDEIRCVCIPSFGPQAWTLPPVDADYPESPERYKYFAVALLEGQVFVNLQPFVKGLVTSPSMIIKHWGLPKVLSLLQRLAAGKISRRVDLVKIWEKDKRYLLAEYLEWLTPQYGSLLVKNWPPLDSNDKSSGSSQNPSKRLGLLVDEEDESDSSSDSSSEDENEKRYRDTDEDESD
eukprot:TRINITY_DN776_c0_g1_i6.p1 TRINITY_DN776_c0_g1~~TRINITY_DN776_c0_g1_i6.p1  ORF type:complete len:1355 (+),score=401.33 TRINITY_DN776_c0_g1_i6:191-4066(+)